VKIIARAQAYHGLTLQTMSATSMGHEYWKMFEPRVPGFVHIQTCYPYRYQGAKPGEGAGEAAARELEEAILREGPETVAAFVGEPIHGAGGVFYPTDDYWPRVREICTRHGVLLIDDEIITGFCRTGRWFALPHWNVTPDILSFAKGATSGYLPLGGIMVSGAIKEVMDSVHHDDRWLHAYTNSGHPTCCAVALKNIEIMERERLWENSAAMGARLKEGLEAAFGDHPNMGEIRGGKGLLAAVEFVEDRATKKNFAPELKFAPALKAEMIKRGVVTRTRPALGDHPAQGDILFFAPPLVVTAAEIDRLVSVSRDAVEAVLGLSLRNGLSSTIQDTVAVA
jgi:adenosylmethionine-8-amino-7-oxononanoate aminotransferase